MFIQIIIDVDFRFNLVCSFWEELVYFIIHFAIGSYLKLSFVWYTINVSNSSVASEKMTNCKKTNKCTDRCKVMTAVHVSRMVKWTN
jgi:hypothetical protein